MTTEKLQSILQQINETQTKSKELLTVFSQTTTSQTSAVMPQLASAFEVTSVASMGGLSQHFYNMESHKQFFRAQSQQLKQIKASAEAVVSTNEELLNLLRDEAPLIAEIADTAKTAAVQIHDSVDASLKDGAEHVNELKTRKNLPTNWACTQLALITVGALTVVGLISKTKSDSVEVQEQPVIQALSADLAPRKT